MKSLTRLTLVYGEGWGGRHEDGHEGGNLIGGRPKQTTT